MNENNLNELELNKLEINKTNLNELSLDELKEYIKNTDPQDMDFDEMLNVKLLVEGAVSIEEFPPGLIAALRADNKMISDNGKSYQIASKTSRGNKILYNALPGSNHDKVDDLFEGKEKALQADVSIAFSDNITVIENSLDAIKSQVQAISKGIKAEESRYKAKFIDPLNVKINELSEDVANNEILQVQVDKLEKENEKLSAEVSELRDKRNNNEALIEKQKETINNLTAESRELIKASQEFDAKLKQATKDLEAELSQKLEDIENTKKTLESTELKLTQAIENEKSLKDDIKNMKALHTTEINKLNSSSMESERNLNSTILNLNIEINTLKSQNTSYETNNQALSNENKDLKENAKQDTARIKGLEKDVESLRVDNEALKVQLRGKDALITSNNNVMSNDAQTIKDLNNNIFNLKNSLDEEIRLRQEKEHEITQLKLIIDNLQSKTNLTKDTVEDTAKTKGKAK